MKIPTQLSSVFFLLFLGIPPVNSVISDVNTFSFSKTNITCPCATDFAGDDKVVCLSVAALGVVIGCDDGGSTECADLCYEWAPAQGLAESDRKNKNPTVYPTAETTYTVIVSNKEGNLVGDAKSITVFVIGLEIVLYKPRVITGNTTTLVTDPVLGAQTFVNLDNDDNDNFYDNDLLEPTGLGVVGGDDELVRVELRLMPVDLPDKFVRLIALQGAPFIRVWGNEAKTSASEYVLNTDIELVDRGTYLGVDLWVEGISPHTIQRETILSMTYKGDNLCPTDAPITIIGVESITWKGRSNNSFNDNNLLDADPNYLHSGIPPPTWPTAVRIFPDARLAHPLDARRSANLVTRLTVGPIEDVIMYVRNFDIDDPAIYTIDPSTGVDFVDPNDRPGGGVGMYSGGTMLNYTPEEDNRTTGSKHGNFVGQVGDIAPILFQANNPLSAIVLNDLSMHPGDNYRAVVNGDADFFANLQNRDYRDGHKIVHTNTVSPGPNPSEIQISTQYASPVLTVWRFMHFEEDAMERYDPSNEQNFLFTIFTDFISPGAHGNNITQLNGAVSSTSGNPLSILYNRDPLPLVTYVADLSPTIDETGVCQSLGRFGGGLLEIINQPLLILLLHQMESFRLT